MMNERRVIIGDMPKEIGNQKRRWPGFTRNGTVKVRGKAVLVCTEKRGVFFGYGDPAMLLEDPIILKRCRMCIYWSADMKGVMGLATRGPSETCKIGEAVEEIQLRGITCVVTCSKEAVEAWEAAPWRS